ncbi:PREDICTED: Fanconi anemia group A protein homolog isoform X3 [Amphimedon queenslandica]|nr:PREDICTED: Fanconi anemia group A protein homolog isoform X3 [Amphimedon queenslandica]|eukprot:XP_019857375.1 PREDICTED: Fanconi anemia group A protein homolog isoform X3 [Amphimedon queenslandica]
MSLSQSPETFGTWLLINKLKETNDDKVIDGVISVGVILRDLMYINHQNLIELLIKHISFISLYSIFKLHTAGLVLIHEILSNSSNMKETVCEYFITSLVSSSSHELPAGIIRVLLSLSFSQYNEYNNDNGLNSTAQCSNNILMEAVQRDVHCSSDPVIINIIVSVCNELGLSLQLFLDHLLSSIISRPPFCNAREMLTRQNEVTLSCIEEGKSKLLSKVAMLMGHSLCWKNIIKISQSSNVNWFGLLQFVSCCVHTHIDHVTGFKKCITDLLLISLSQENEEYLIISLLLSRQGGMEGGHVFPSYGNWFKSVFGSSQHSLMDSKRTLTFLIKCLTNLINEDPPYCLQAHITFPPRKLAKCSQLVTGYIVKAKSRLDYLQVLTLLSCSKE